MLAILLLPACKEVIELDTDNSAPVIVIYGCLTDEPGHQTIQVSSSAPYFDQEPNQGISGATVSILSSEGETILFQENDTVPGLYETIDLIAGVPGVSYSLSVEVDFNQDGIPETYTASTLMQTPVEIDSIRIGHTVNKGYEGYQMYMYAQEPPTTDFYLAKYEVNDSLVTAKISMYEVMKDDLINGQYLNGMSLMMFQDAAYEEKEGNDYEEEMIYLREGDKVTLLFSRIEKGYFNFVRQSKKEMHGENPFFGGPSSNIATNISGGGVGYFTAFCVTRMTTVVDTK